MTHRIFLAEDDPDDIYLIKMAFQESQHNIDLVSFEEGRALMHRLNQLEAIALPHLIMLDLNLPVFDGKATLRSLKESSALKAIPVVIYTTSKSERDIKDVYALGANSYMVKSPDYSELVSKIKTLCDYWFETVQIGPMD
ncbi:MAG: response regulator [Oleiphilaceae bacterium]|nr:response regulator [Oleiphilaceae bacterium]